MACDVCDSWARPDLCGGEVGVASSSMGAFSVSMCRTVVSRGLEPRWAFEALLGTPDPQRAAGWRAGLADWAAEAGDACLAFYGVDEATFVASLVAAGEAEANLPPPPPPPDDPGDGDPF